MKPASNLTRLFACLMVSCLLHVALFFMPYLGISTGTTGFALQGGRKLKRPHILNATLALAGKPTIATPEAPHVVAEGVSQGDASAEPVANDQTRPPLDPTVGIGLLPIPAPTYYTTDKLTRHPQPTAEPLLDTPDTWPIPAVGSIVMKLWISEHGDVVSVDVEKSELPELFSRTAVAAFGKLRFTPGEINGHPVGTVMRIEVIYDDPQKPAP